MGQGFDFFVDTQTVPLGTMFVGRQPRQHRETRAQTVMNGLRFIIESDPHCEWVLVHDAARPCLSAASLADLIDLGLTWSEAAGRMKPDPLEIGAAHEDQGMKTKA